MSGVATMLKNQGYDPQTGVWNDSLVGNYL